MANPLALPDRNNRYGQLRAPAGLAAVACCFSGPPWRARVRPSGVDGAPYLMLVRPGLELETTPLGAEEYLLNGAVAPTAAGRASLRQASAALTDAGIIHRLALYDPATRHLLEELRYGWPARRDGT